jgi:hypothetical protein
MLLTPSKYPQLSPISKILGKGSREEEFSKQLRIFSKKLIISPLNILCCKRQK